MRCFDLVFNLAGLPNGGVLEDGYLTVERRVGKRGRRQKIPAKVFDGKLGVLPAKENVESGSLDIEGGLKEGKF